MPTTPFPESRLPAWLVRNRNFVLLWAAYGVAAVGDHLSEIALLKSRDGLARPDATRVQALITFGFFLPFVILGPLAGWWSDRYSRRTTMIVADLLRAALVWNLALIVPALARWLDPHGLGDYSIVIPLAVVGALAAFFSPARQAMLPTLIRADQLVRANALISALGTIGTIVSAVVGGYLVVAAGPEWNFHINAATFVLSALFVSGIRLSMTRAAPHPPLAGVWAPVADGFRYVRQHRRVLQMILLGTVFWAAAGMVISMVPAIVKVFFGDDYAAAGNFRGIIGLGLATGAAVMTVIGPALPPQIAVLGSLAGAAFWLLLLDVAFAFKLGIVLTGISLFGIGGAGAGLLVTIMATIQRFVPDSRRGRIFGVTDMATMGAMVLATGALGLPNIPNLDSYIPALLGLTGLGFVLGFIAAWRQYRRDDPHAWIQGVLLWLVRFYARFWCRMQRIGACTIPARGPVIVAANHTAGVDPLLMQATSPYRILAFLVAAEYYHRPFAGWFMRQAGCVPIDRKNPGKSFLAGCLKTLRDGGVLGIFPQGTWAEPGQEEPGAKSGIGLLALRTGATVIPCHISGTRYFDSPFAALFARHHVRIRYGKPVDLSAFAGRAKDRAAHEEASALVMERIWALAPPENAAPEPAR